jgi:hypothetical protein
VVDRQVEDGIRVARRRDHPSHFSQSEAGSFEDDVAIARCHCS